VLVDASDRSQLARGARDEGLVRGFEILRKQRRLTHLDADLLTHFEEIRARHTLEQPRGGFRRQRHSGAHHEEVGLRALRQFAPVVAHQPFLAAAAIGFLHRERVVQQVVGLDERVHGTRMISKNRHQRDGDAVGFHPRRRGLNRLHDDHQRRGGRRLRVVIQFADSARQEDADVFLVHGAGGLHGVGDPFGQRRIIERDIEVQRLGRLAQAAHVTVVQKRHVIVRSKRFVHALAVQKAMIVDRHHRLGRRGDLAVDIHRAANGHL
jgi:hypothetical protein